MQCPTRLKKSNITELVESNDGNDDKWFKAKVAIIDADQISGKEKKDGYLRNMESKGNPFAHT